MEETAKQSDQQSAVTVTVSGDVESVRCYCCGMTEECTGEYIARVRERHEGCWICGLCAEAVKYEAIRSRRSGAIGPDEAMKRHVSFCEQFRSSSPPISPSEKLISAVKHIFRRTLDSPRKGDGAEFCRPLGRSRSCFAAIPDPAPSQE